MRQVVRVELERVDPPVRVALGGLAISVLVLAAVVAADNASLGTRGWWAAVPVLAMTWSIWVLAVRDERWRVVAVAVDGDRHTLGVGDREEMVALMRSVTSESLERALRREGALDLVRGLAVLLMVFAHYTDQLLLPAAHDTPFGHLYRYTRGFTAPLFFVVSGWSFALGVLPRLQSEGLGAVPFARKLRRAALLLAWGYALVLPWWAPGFPFDAPAEVWKPFWTAGVLECLAVSMVLTLLVLVLARRPARFLAACAAAAWLSFAAAPYLAGHVATWPEPLRGFFDRQGVPGGFPIAPWAGFFLAGVSLGGTLWWAHVAPRGRIVALAAFAAMTGVAQAFATPHHALVLLRLSVTAAVLALAVFAARRGATVPFLRDLGKHALTFYVSHMLFLWGVPFVFGLATRFPAQLAWWQVAGLTFTSVVATRALLALWASLKDRLADARGERELSPQ